AESPAMLFYLDNWMSSDPSANVGATGPRPPNFGFGRPGRGGRGGFGRTPRGQDPAMRRAPQQRRKPGLNENYARELMELHTLGVDGGYTQKDVVEVARCFTGWTIDRPRAVGRREAGAAGGFTYEPRMHDDGEKVVLGQKIKAGGGRNDGAQVLDMLARHPSTARFIATKLARRFVSDNPPDSLIDRATTRFAGTNGDIREVVRTIVTSPEFFAPEAYRAKVKSPLEFVVSAVRVTGADVRNSLPLAQSLRQLGMPLYFAQPPTGYADRAEAWVNTGALLNRMNFAVALVENRLRGVAVDLGTLAGGDAASTPDRMVRTILTNDASPATRGTLAKGEKMTDVVALAIGAPEFQRR
ncbi:MAG: DUF1800 domain-containing protein, partial [Acidobacteria bacterium]|nr:DUF1800 domain-containing protein [Acidobacteriota bacterium]